MGPLPEVVVEIIDGDVYVSHNLHDVYITLYDYDGVEHKNLAFDTTHPVEVSEGQQAIRDAHDAYSSFARECEDSARAYDEMRREYPH